MIIYKYAVENQCYRPTNAADPYFVVSQVKKFYTTAYLLN